MYANIQPNAECNVYIGGDPSARITYGGGNKAKLFIQNRSIEWEQFKNYLESNVSEENRAQELEKFSIAFFKLDDQNAKQGIIRYMTQDISQFIQCIRKAAFLHEPLAWSIREVFFKIAHIYEAFLQRLVSPEEWIAFDESWTINDPDKTSSKPLWNLTHDAKFHEAILKNHPKLKEWEIGGFEYKGFCPKVPGERFLALLKFPVHELLAIMQWEDEESKLKQMSDKICTILAKGSEDININTLVNNHIRADPPRGDEDIMFLIEEALKYEADVLPILEKLEEHYIKKSNLMNELVLAITDNNNDNDDDNDSPIVVLEDD
jgi:hypothetical protein